MQSQEIEIYLYSLNWFERNELKIGVIVSVAVH